MRRELLLISVGVLLVTAGCTTSPGGGGESPTYVPLLTEERETVNATVVEVVDGDTLTVRLPGGDRETLRLLGVDTPEVHSPPAPSEWEGIPNTPGGESCLREYGNAASDFVREGAAPGSTVKLAFDPESDKRGYYDRLLVYVIVDGENLNHQLIDRGLARFYDSELSERAAFLDSESVARENQRGAWTCQETNT